MTPLKMSYAMAIKSQFILINMRPNVKIFAKTIEDAAYEQISKLSECAAYKDCDIRVMPDVHAGKGCTIGTVVKLTDKVIPNTVGVDIGCGMKVVRLGKNKPDLEKLDRIINEKVPSGFNVHNEVLPFVKNDGLEILSNIRCLDDDYIDMALRSIGSLGGGNHFIEVDVDDDGLYYLVIHTGSRNLGVRVCNHYQELAYQQCNKNKCDISAIIDKLKREGREKEIENTIKTVKSPVIPKELSYLEGEIADDYFNDMYYAQLYAHLNRYAIAHIICENMGYGSGISSFTTIHNYIDIATGTLRKGAISTKEGEHVIIPMNMRDGSLICVGKGNEDWLCSAPHGAGRLMSRSQAKKELSLEDYKSEMSCIYSSSVCEETIDEAPMVYKPMDEIMQLISPTVNILSVIKPIYNFKAKS